MISTDLMHTGAGVETPPAVGTCSADQVRLVAPLTAAWTVPSYAATPIRLRGQLAAAGLTGSFLGATAPTSVQETALRVVVGGPIEHTSTTPGDLPPEDPPSR